MEKSSRNISSKNSAKIKANFLFKTCTWIMFIQRGAPQKLLENLLERKEILTNIPKKGEFLNAMLSHSENK